MALVRGNESPGKRRHAGHRPPVAARKFQKTTYPARIDGVNNVALLILHKLTKTHEMQGKWRRHAGFSFLQAFKPVQSDPLRLSVNIHRRVGA